MFKEKGFSSLVLGFFIVIIIFCSLIYLVFPQNLHAVLNAIFQTTQEKKVNLKTEESSEKWKGLLLTNNGFLILNEDGSIEVDPNGNPNYFLPPGIQNKISQSLFENWSQSEYSTYDSVSLSPDGWIYFFGADGIKEIYDPSTIYRWKVGSNLAVEKVDDLNGQKKFISITFSPDFKKLVYFQSPYGNETFSQEELVNNLDQINDTFQKSVSQAYIYDLESKNRYILEVNADGHRALTLNHENEYYLEKFTWKRNILYVFDSAGVVFVDMSSFPHTKVIKEAIAPVSQLEKNMIVSADGEKYLIKGHNSVMNINGENLYQYSDHQLASASATANELKNIMESNSKKDQIILNKHSFSQDSSKFLLLKTDPKFKPISFEEVDIAEKTQHPIATIDEIADSSQFNLTSLLSSFFTYNPSGDSIFFPINNQENETFLFNLDLKTKKVDKVNLLNKAKSTSQIQFLGWYRD